LKKKSCFLQKHKATQLVFKIYNNKKCFWAPVQT